MSHDPTSERYAIFVKDELAERAPVFKAHELAVEWLARRLPKDGYAEATVRNVRQEAIRLRQSVRDMLNRAEELDAAITPNSPKAMRKQRNRLRRDASKLLDRMAKLNAIRHPAKAVVRSSVKDDAEIKRGPYSTYGSSNHVMVVSGGLPGLGKKR